MGEQVIDVGGAVERPEGSDGHLAEIVREWKAAWRPGVAAWVGGALGYSIWASMASLFVQPLQNAFGWSRGDIALAGNAGLVSAFAAPMLGRLVDRLGVRPVLLTGLVLTSICYGLFALMNGSLWVYYALYLAFILCGTTTTGITYSRIVIGAFHRTRGSALAIVRSGLAFSGALLPGIVFLSISRWGYVGGYLTLAALILFISLPLAWAWVPAKSPSSLTNDAAASPEGRWAMLRNPKVLVLCVAGALNYAPVVAILSQLMPLAEAKGLSAAAGVGAVSLVGLAALGGALLSGLLVDRFWAPGVAFVLNILPAAGCLLLLPDQIHAAKLYAAALLIGLGQGAELDLVAYMVARYFGLRTYATIYGLSVLTIGITASLGISTIGLLFDRFGNYDLAVMIAAGSFTLAAFTYLLMGRYPPAKLAS